MSNQKEEMIEQLGLNQSGNVFWNTKTKVFLGLLSVIALLAFFFWPKEVKTVYVTADVVEDKLVIIVSTTGNVEPTDKVDVGSEVSGTLVNVYVDFDDKVSKGMLLAKIDTTKLEASHKSALATLQQIQASLLEAEATLKESKRAYDRGKDLSKLTQGQKPSPKEMDILLASYERAMARKMNVEAQVDQAKASVDMSRYNLEKAVIISPIDGIVLERKVEAGQTVVAAMQIPLLFTIAKDLVQMKLLVSIDEADVGQVHVGQKARFTIDAYPDKQFNAEVSNVRLNAKIINSVVTYDAELAVNNKDLLLRPGMTASTEIIVKTVPKGLLVPNSALRYRPLDENESAESPEPHVWVLKENQPVKIVLTLGASDGVLTSVQSTQLTTQSKVIVKSKKVSK